MATRSTIEWTESKWNPVTGCVKVSPGCKNCYAERMARRLQAMGQANYVNGFDLAVHEKALEKAADNFRQFDERPLSGGSLGALHPKSL